MINFTYLWLHVRQLAPDHLETLANPLYLAVLLGRVCMVAAVGQF